MNPTLYGWQHILYLIVVFSLMALGIWAAKKYIKKDTTLVLNIKITALVLLLSILGNRYSQVVKFNNWLYMIPDTFCGTSSMVLALGVLFTKRDSGVLHFIVYLGFLGGTLTMFYPDFIGQAPSLFYMPTLTGLLHHTVMVYLILLMVATGYFEPSIRKWYCVPLGSCCFMTWGLFIYDILDKNAMTIGRDFEGISGLTWFNVGLLFFVLYAVFISSYELLRKKYRSEKLIK